MTDVKIRCDDCKFVEDCVDYGWQDCKKFTPKPSEPMTKLCDTCEYLKFCARSGIEDVGCDRYKRDTTTHKEWLQTATTEQIAEWIASVVRKAIYIKENNGIVMLESAIWWEEWLKQPHREVTE